jgi:hypothetical protein
VPASLFRIHKWREDVESIGEVSGGAALAQQGLALPERPRRAGARGVRERSQPGSERRVREAAVFVAFDLARRGA